MNRLIRFYNQNRKSIKQILIFVIFILIIIRIFNNIAKENDIKSYNKITKSENITINNENKITKNESNDSFSYVNSELSSEEIKKFKETLENFIKYCNIGDKEKAYELLTNECKENLYKDIKAFDEKYYQKIFFTKKNYSINRITKNLYKIKYIEDPISVGRTEYLNYIEGYISFSNERNKEYKINIEDFIERRYINALGKEKNIQFEILYNDIYLSKMVYKFKINNNSENPICIKNMYIKDNNQNKYYFEEKNKDIIVNQKETKIIEMSINQKYNPKINISDIVLEKIILNYNKDMKNNEIVLKNFFSLEISIK